MRRAIASFVIAVVLVGCNSKGCGSDDPTPGHASAGGDSTSPSAPATTATPVTRPGQPGQPAIEVKSVLIAESSGEPATEPTASLAVQGGVGAEIVYRGWPVRIAYRILDGAAAARPTLSVRGPTDVTPQPAPGGAALWVIAPEKSAALTPGAYVFSAGAASTEVIVEDEPAELSAGDREVKRAAFISHALALGDTAGAERIAREWVTASAKNPAAHEALGDVLGAAGKPNDALAAYNKAMKLIPPGDEPPSILNRKAAALRRASLAKMATRPATAPTANELAFFKIIEEGDALLAACDYPRALRAYERARAHYTATKLTLGLYEVDNKIAYTRDQQKHATTAPAVVPR